MDCKCNELSLKDRYARLTGPSRRPPFIAHFIELDASEVPFFPLIQLYIFKKLVILVSACRIFTLSRHEI